MAAAELLADAITGRENADAAIFSPQRFNAAIALETLREGAQAVKGLTLQHLTVPEAMVADLRVGHGGVVDIGGQKAGVYRDDTGRLHAVNTQCPHLGCQLEWNPDEKSWDCPCHGSRFDFHGYLIDNPAGESLERLDVE